MRPVVVASVAWMLGCGAGPERSATQTRREVPAPADAVDRSPPPEHRSAPRQGEPLVGRPAPEWGSLTWLGTEPLRLQDLRGQVVLIRFWTDTCPFCRATAPALAQLDADYGERGVTIVGMYHPKPRGTTRTPQQVAEVTAGWGWSFPVALDLDWTVLDSFWLAHGSRRYTSVSFVLDREGIIRHVHPGPEFHPGGPEEHRQCRDDYEQIQATLDALLAEPVAMRGAEPVAPRSP